jgi:hypothetical protein
VVKTRGSTHDWGMFSFSITKGGIRVGERVDGGVGPANSTNLNKSSRPRKRPKRREGGQ